MLRGLSTKNFNPFHCCTQEAGTGTTPVPGWMQKHRSIAQTWLQDARTNQRPPTWGEPLCEVGGGAPPGQNSLLLDTLVPRHDPRDPFTDNALLVMGLPPEQAARLPEFVEHLVHRDVRHLLVLGDIDTPGLRLNTSAQGLPCAVTLPSLRAALTQAPARTAKEGWTSTLEIAFGMGMGCNAEQTDGAPASLTTRTPRTSGTSPAHTLQRPAVHKVEVLHVAPRHTTLLDPDELRAVIAWVRQTGANAANAANSAVAVTGGGDSLPHLPAMVGQLVSTMAFERRYPGRNPCTVLNGRGQDEPMREALRELHQRRDDYVGSWQHLASVAAVCQDQAADMRISRMDKYLQRPPASPEPSRRVSTGNAAVQRPRSPGTDADETGTENSAQNSTEEVMPWAWRANPNGAMLQWDNPAFIDDEVPLARPSIPPDSPRAPSQRRQPTPLPRSSVIRAVQGGETHHPAPATPIPAPRSFKSSPLPPQHSPPQPPKRLVVPGAPSSEISL